MSVHESIGYLLRCDFPGCKVETQDVNGEYGSWTDLDHAIEEWCDADGYHGDEGTYCPTHTIYEADEDGERSSIRPMPHTIDSLFVLAERRIAERISIRASIATYEVDRRCRAWQLRDESAARREVKHLRELGVSFEQIIAARGGAR